MRGEIERVIKEAYSEGIATAYSYSVFSSSRANRRKMTPEDLTIVKRRRYLENPLTPQKVILVPQRYSLKTGTYNEHDMSTAAVKNVNCR